MTRANEAVDGEGEFLAPPQAPPNLNIPPSTSTVSVSVIDTGVRLSLPAAHFLHPPISPPKARVTGPAYAFLVTHQSSGAKLLFDLSVRKDHTSGFAPAVQRLVDDPASEFWVRWVETDSVASASASAAAGEVSGERGERQGEVAARPRDVVDVLEAAGVDVAAGEVEAVVWSHAHFDHTGDVTRFPAEKTKLVVGPGFREAFGEGWPRVEEAPVKGVEWEGRELVEVRFEGAGRIGRFRARDWWGDGSFYLLDTPGHAVGHLCGLARVRAGAAAGEEAFVFMGGDCAHHPAQFRPSPYLPLPTTITPSPFPPQSRHHHHGALSCPGCLFTPIHPAAATTEKPAAAAATTPFYRPSRTLPHNFDDCLWSIDGLEEFDADERVLVVNAHDESLLRLLYDDEDGNGNGNGKEGEAEAGEAKAEAEAGRKNKKWVWPQGTLDGWREAGLATRGRWAFLGDFEGAVGA
ncbi:n-acyl homoserine lactonase [Diplodia corticola]|uniref:N-acyl homoserine lactonase n=1 Tax=Diplodia corticola TaxID=236234 RepID=A0A1J9RXK8_9PEZI|nr:n-acyl homoserine lactonase [Diplodia corticola]OJD33079.1 n-acyl homoserine lactonase [Diplodia corticola]